MHFSSIGAVSVLKLHGKTQTDRLKITAERPFKWPRTGRCWAAPALWNPALYQSAEWWTHISLMLCVLLFAGITLWSVEALQMGIVLRAAGRAWAEPSPATELSICELTSIQFPSLSVFLEMLKVFFIQSPHIYWWAVERWCSHSCHCSRKRSLQGDADVWLAKWHQESFWMYKYFYHIYVTDSGLIKDTTYPHKPCLFCSPPSSQLQQQITTIDVVFIGNGYFHGIIRIYLYITYYIS